MEIIVKGADFSGNRVGIMAKKINTAIFNGTSSFAEITPITLSANGDYIEFILDIENTTIGYYFAYREKWGKPILGLTQTKLALRLDNNTWVESSKTVSYADVTNAHVKISYEGTDVKIYIDGTLVTTYDNSTTQAGLTFIGFAKYQTTSNPDFWKGSIKKVRTNKFNDGEWCGIDEFPGWSATDVTIV